MHDGWIRLYRKLQECWVWEDKEPFDKRSAWIDLLLTANHADAKLLFNGELITVQRGQILTSVRKLSVKWKWSVNKVYRFLKLLESDKMLQKESNKDRTLLTIVNYSVYQGGEYTNEYTNGNSDGYTDGSTNEYKSETPTDTPSEHKQECNNDKNVKNVNNNMREKKPKKKYYDDPNLDSAFKEFLSMRTKIKKPLATEKAFSRLKNKLEDLSGGDTDMAIAILNQSVDHCWSDVYGLKNDCGSRHISEDAKPKSVTDMQLDSLAERQKQSVTIMSDEEINKMFGE